MTESKLKEIINALLFAAGILLYEGLILIEPYSHYILLLKQKPIKEEIIVEEVIEELIIPNFAVSSEMELRNQWFTLNCKYYTIETEYAGRHFITAYCPWECGYNGENYPAGWRTSSGEICHYSDDPLVPTTCAIDRNYHRYGEYLMVDGKIYVTEDTGPGVQGMWIDIFVESMEEVQYFGSHYTDVYYVEFIEHNYTERYLHRLFIPRYAKNT